MNVLSMGGPELVFIDNLTLGHKYFVISFIIAQSAFRCSFLVTVASARRSGLFPAGLDGSSRLLPSVASCFPPTATVSCLSDFDLSSTAPLVLNILCWYPVQICVWRGDRERGARRIEGLVKARRCPNCAVRSSIFDKSSGRGC